MMNTINRDDISTHLNLLGWLYIVANAFFLLLAAFGFFLFPTLAVISHDPDVTMVLSVLGTVFGLLMLLLALPGLVAGYGLLRRKPWARLWGMVIAVFNLLNFPFGTVIGIYALYVLSQQAAIAFFEPPFPASSSAGASLSAHAR